MAITTIPKPFYEVAFNADPNQAAIPPYWADISSRVQFPWSTTRGRQYELDQNETGEWHPTLANPDGALDPTNSASPYWPNVIPYRGARIRVPTAPTVNLFPQNIATGGLTIAATDSIGNWFSAAQGTVAYATGLTAAPSGQTNAAAWTLPISSTGGNPGFPLYFAPSTPIPANNPHQDNVQVVAGTTYTASAYAMRSAGGDATVTCLLQINWYDGTATRIATSPGSTVTVTSAGWVRATSTAAAPAGAMWATCAFYLITPVTTTALNTIYVTGGQFEQAASASAWADPGPVFFIFNGFSERWPQAWSELSGTYGTVGTVGVDASVALSQSTLQAPFVSEVLRYNPNFFYQLDDPAGSTACSDTVGKRIAVPIEDSPFGAGSLVLATQVTSTTLGQAFVGTPGPVATFNNPLSGSNVQMPETYLPLHKTTATPGPPTNGIWTRILAFRTSTVPGAGNVMSLWTAYPPSWVSGGNQSSTWFQINSAGQIWINGANAGGVGLGYVGGTSICDGNWHQVALSYGTNIGIYVDGVRTALAGSPGSPTGIASDVIGASIMFGSTLYEQGYVGDLAHAIELPVALGDAQVLNLYNSWRSASSGESSGARVQRVLNWTGWTGPTAIDAGMTSSMGPATDLTGATALDAINNVALTENGDFFISSAGVPTFQARNARYNKTTPVYTFGEHTGAGEWPFEVLALDYDPSHIANNVQVTQYQGPTFAASDGTSVKRSFPRVYQRTVNVTSPNEASDAANYLLSQYKTARLRVSALRLHPSAVPGLFAVCLNLELGTRIRVNRRPIGAPMITFDGFIEKIDWSWDPDTNDVYVDLQCSPADLIKYWTLAALHTTLNLQAASGQNKATINALPDAAVNALTQSLPSGYQLTFEPGTPRAETMTIAPGGIPSTSPGYATAQLTFTANFTFTHNANSVVCEPLPSGVTDPTTYDTQSVLGAASTTFNQPGTAGTNTITINALPDAKVNALASSVPQSWIIWLSPGTPNFETATVSPTGIPVTYPGYTTATLTLTANLAHNHAIGDVVCDPLPGGDTNPSQVLATTIPAY